MMMHSKKGGNMNITYKHTNIIAKDWQRLANFYQVVFDCKPVPPERDLSGAWIDKATGVKDAHIRGVHLALPGTGDKPPTLEIFQYDNNEVKPSPAANREGITHIAFEVDDIQALLEMMRRHGGGAVGEISTKEVPGVGVLTFIYATDPEGNIVELLNWK
jgi:predicted enzyme related to lactoylglutathione lyase